MKPYIICVSLFFSLVTSFYIPIALDSCPNECGDVKIPYPFGIRKNCSLSTEFLVNCNQSFSPPRPVITIEGLNLYIRRITLSPPQIHVYYDNKIYKKSLDGNITALKTWKIGNQDCIIAKANQSSYACKEHGECLNSADGDGYTCICSVGYRGNPYLAGGCTDGRVNAVKGLRNCKLVCTKTLGGITCSCQQRTYWTGSKFPFNPYYAGSNCNVKESTLIYYAVLGGLGILFCLCFCFGMIAKVIYANSFKKKILERRTHTQTPKIFSLNDMLAGCNDRIFVRTKLELLNLNQIDAVLDRIISISNITHKNIQKFIGCCLERTDPTLIFELFSRRSLFHHLHINGDSIPLSWKTRIRIAAEVADAIAFLHSLTPRPFVYREMRSSNILLDNSYNVKVSIESYTMWFPPVYYRTRAQVKKKYPYLDPEFSQSGILTDKSDVYAYGVVLVEILTGKNPMVFHISDEKECLSTYFLRKMKDNRLLEMLDPLVLLEGEEKQVTSIAELAVKCLETKGDERPNMKDIVEELEGLKDNRGF